MAGAQWELGLSAGSVGFILCVKETAFSGAQSEQQCGGRPGGGDSHQTILSSVFWQCYSLGQVTSSS